jgi:hypothetical protein
MGDDRRGRSNELDRQAFVSVGIPSEFDLLLFARWVHLLSNMAVRDYEALNSVNNTFDQSHLSIVD